MNADDVGATPEAAHLASMAADTAGSATASCGIADRSESGQHRNGEGGDQGRSAGRDSAQAHGATPARTTDGILAPPDVSGIAAVAKSLVLAVRAAEFDVALPHGTNIVDVVGRFRITRAAGAPRGLGHALRSGIVLVGLRDLALFARPFRLSS